LYGGVVFFEKDIFKGTVNTLVSLFGGLENRPWPVDCELFLVYLFIALKKILSANDDLQKKVFGKD